jgi:ribosomal protein S5
VIEHRSYGVIANNVERAILRVAGKSAIAASASA